METSMPQDPKKASVSIPDLKSANEVVCKIMEILKKAQKCGFQIKPPLLSAAQKNENSTEAQKSTEVNVIKSAEPEKANVVGAQVHLVPAIGNPSTLPVVQTKLEVAAMATLVEKDNILPSPTVAEKPIPASVALPVALCTPSAALNSNVLVSNQKQQAECFDSDTGIEASDLTSLLEEFEKSEAKDEERLPPSADKMAVGNSGPEKPFEKKVLLDKHLPPELLNTAGLTPPATPPHQLLWKSNGSLTGKSKPLQVPVQEKASSSTLKTAKLIEAKPLPQSKLKSRTLPSAPSVTGPAVHVGSGDHDYCILSATRQEKEPEAAENRMDSTSLSAQKEEGSRWNVKHHQNIIIKPIVQFNKPPQSKACPKQSTSNAPSVIREQSASCVSAHPAALCRNVQEVSNDPLDHRTNVLAECAVKSPPGSVLMSPDSSPCRSEPGETRTDVKNENSVSRRSLRCYRKYRNSPSPQKSTWRGRSSGSRSASSSSSSSSCSSSRSRSRSPPSKRRRT
uniref:Uncharacterized protein n=2 Tax=Pyxicephalus adspersus TaxID=30357 RepID=A0AAV2ZM46_PYXAD|nr:TPA: hypothetical protein GDO54_004211 [Pyxicephalus adspersus]